MRGDVNNTLDTLGCAEKDTHQVAKMQCSKLTEQATHSLRCFVNDSSCVMKSGATEAIHIIQYMYR